MNKKIILHGLGNEGNFNFYIFDKKQKVAMDLSKIFYKTLMLTWNFFEEYKTKDGTYKPHKINIERYKDFHQDIGSIKNKSRADIFYGNKRMFMVINCSPKLRLKFNEELFKIAKMPKSKKIKLFKKYK